VIGTGAAGLTGAVVGAIEGLQVTVLEKTDLVGGTTSVSGGGFWIPVNDHLKERGIQDSPEEALAYLRACGGEAAEEEILEALVDTGRVMIRYLEDRGGMSFRAWPAVGGTIDYRPWHPGWKPGARTLDAGKFTLADLGEWAPKIRTGAQSSWLMDKLDYYSQRMHLLAPNPDAPRRVRVAGEGVGEYLSSGSALIGQLLKGCLQRGVKILTETPARDLVVSDGRVVGVRAERGGRPLGIRARRGVLVATGGFSGNKELMRMWLTRPMLHTCEIESCSGDGQLMGMAAGARVGNFDAWWMPQTYSAASTSEATNIGGTREDRSLPHTMIFNRAGRRFVNEAQNYYDVCEAFGTKQDGPKNLPAWLLFDEQGRSRYGMLHSKVPSEPVDWYTSAVSIGELASKLGIEPRELEATVEQFNRYAREGRDPDFHRGESPWDIAWGDPENKPNPSLGTIEKPPFHAIPIFPGALATRGGLQVDAKAQVRSALTGEPIPGLYAAGNCSTGHVATAYVGAGATIGPAMTFGYIAARGVGAEVASPAAAAGA
jgi:3-oxosteroid 1-dehydrogenase